MSFDKEIYPHSYKVGMICVIMSKAGHGWKETTQLISQTIVGVYT